MGNNAALRDALEKMLKDRQQQLASCERMLELLQPEWDKVEARSEHDTYVARDYADHTSAARKHRKEIAALEYALATAPSSPSPEGLRSRLPRIRTPITRSGTKAMNQIKLIEALEQIKRGEGSYAHARDIARRALAALQSPSPTVAAVSGDGVREPSDPIASLAFHTKRLATSAPVSPDQGEVEAVRERIARIIVESGVGSAHIADDPDAAAMSDALDAADAILAALRPNGVSREGGE